MEMDRKCLYSTEENCAGQISKEKKKEKLPILLLCI